MATISVLTTADLDVVNKQRELTTEALGPDGVYIRLKETLLDLMNNGDIKSSDKAQIVSTTLANLSGQITSGAMQTALAWAGKEKELELKKLEIGYQLELLKQQGMLAENQVIDSLAGRQLKQAQGIREYGIVTLTASSPVSSNVVNITRSGNTTLRFGSIMCPYFG